MTDMLQLVILLTLLALLSWWLTGRIRRYAIAKKLIDIPNERSSHTIPTPRGGGLSVVISFLIAIGLLLFAEQIALQTFWAIAVGGCIVAAVGFWDDQDHVSPLIRIVAHSIAIIWMLFWLGGVAPLLPAGMSSIMVWLGNLLALISLVWLLNLYNFMDGIDGIASIEAMSVLTGAVLILLSSGLSAGEIPWNLLLLLLCLIACVSGFLCWNWPPAKIFMGDAGSGFLGFMLGAMAMVTSLSHLISIWCWVILLAVFIADATFTLMRRFLAGKRWYEAHRSHAYQHLAIKIGKHAPVTLLTLLINVGWLLPIAYFANQSPQPPFALTLLAYAPLLIAAHFLKAGSEPPFTAP